MSPPTTGTRVVVRRSARRARPDSSRPASSGLPGIASTVSLNHPRSPAMLADRSAIPIANSETGHLNVGSGWWCCCGGWWVDGLVVAGGVDDQLAQQLAGGRVDDADLEVVDEQQDGGSGVGSADAEVVEAAVDPQGDLGVGVDAVVADAGVGVVVAGWGGGGFVAGLGR